MTFARLFSEATVGPLPRTGDLMAVGLPLLRQVEALHRQGLVTGAAGVSMLDYDGEQLSVRVSQEVGESSNWAAVDEITARAHRSGVEVGARRNFDQTGASWAHLTSGDVVTPDGGRPDRPVFVSGYRVWEQLHGHHDALTDIALVGQWLCSYAFALDLDSPEGIDTLALHHRRPSQLNPDLHPVLAGTITEMVIPDRSRRPTDLGEVIARFEHHRDLPANLDLSRAYLPDTDWRRAVLTTLRDRVFDTTRRNRELYYRPTASSVSLTEASIPLMLNVERITPSDVLTWTEPTNKPLRTGGTPSVDLAKWCRFEETPYLAPALDQLISAERKTKVDTGHSRLRLIIAFLRWFDPEANEAVVSPLLTLPAALTRKKGVETRYRLETSPDDATVNPILRHVFARRFDIHLPETVATGDADIAAFIAELEQGVQRTAPAITIERIDKPRIDLLRRRAQLRVDTYRRRRARSLAASGRWRRQEFSYELDDWRPLGHSLYTRFVQPAEIPLRTLAGAAPRPRAQSLTPEAADAAVDDPSVRTSESYALGANEASTDRWQVDLCSVTLAMLGSRRTSLARDYDAVLAGGALDVSATPFEPLFQPDRTGARTEPTEPLRPDQMLVLPADDAQARAVQQAVRGDSFIIQGPPGTGKSQTIANVIAALAAEGRRVLFVCEKRAAIDVVAHRLDQVGLGDLTALIHDSQLDRKQFIYDLGATYRAWLAHRPEEGEEPGGDDGATAHRPAEQRRAQVLATMEASLRPLRELTAELGRDLGAGVSVAQAVERLARLRANASDDGDAGDDASEAIGVPLAEWSGLRPTLDQVQTAMTTSGLAGPLGSVPALRVAPRALVGVDPITTCRQLGPTVAAAGTGIDPALAMDDIATVASLLGPITSAARVGALAALDPSQPQHLDLRAAAQHQTELTQAAERAAGILQQWTTPLPADDTATALAVAQAKEESFLKFLDGRWRQVKSLVEGAYRFEAHQVRPTITSVLTGLNAYHQMAAALQARYETSQAAFGSGDAVALCHLVDTHHQRPAFSALVRSGPHFDATARAMGVVAQVRPSVLLRPGARVGELAALGQALAGTPVATEPALLAWSGLAAANPASLAAVLDTGGSLDEVEARILSHDLAQWSQAVDDQRFSGARIDAAVAELAQLHRDLLAANAEVIVERARATFAANVAHSEASMAGRSSEDKDRKKAYTAGRRIVEREAEKKMRHRSIREMASGESQVVVRDLRPIWLMSPLSVSDTLPLAADLFDVVIFDEASQIPVEDAMPSVFRGPQVIVVGDRMQMPPTRFFSSDDDDDAEVVVDEHGHRRMITLDSDSFLTQSELALGSSMLNWHYRSRFESLIAYSNHAFYGGRLATIPDTALPQGRRAELRGDDASSAVVNTPEALARPISFHHLTHGQYRDRRNGPEADYIAELVRAVLGHDRDLTIGVVAFSEAQQGAIEAALDELAAIDADFAERYEAELTRTDDGEHVGLFVKNLENVQGDERDLIIMSVCYGPDPEGRIRMNFGPINNAGGERRLNVIFSRARQHMAVVSSMRGSDITNLHNEGAAHLAGFLTYAAAESRGEIEVTSAQLRSLAGGPDRAGSEAGAVAAALAAELRDRGWSADVAVGRSTFRVDVAIAIDGTYRLGVLFEPDEDAAGEGQAAARYVAEAGVLDAFGWPIVRVPLSDWFADRDRVVERVEVAARARVGAEAATETPGADHE